MKVHPPQSTLSWNAWMGIWLHVHNGFNQFEDLSFFLMGMNIDLPGYFDVHYRVLSHHQINTFYHFLFLIGAGPQHLARDGRSSSRRVEKARKLRRGPLGGLFCQEDVAILVNNDTDWSFDQPTAARQDPLFNTSYCRHLNNSTLNTCYFIYYTRQQPSQQYCCVPHSVLAFQANNHGKDWGLLPLHDGGSWQGGVWGRTWHCSKVDGRVSRSETVFPWRSHDLFATAYNHPCSREA